MYDHSFRLDRDDSEPLEPPDVIIARQDDGIQEPDLFSDYPGCELEPCSECRYRGKCHNLDMIGEM